MPKVLTLEKAKAQLRLTDQQTHLDAELEDIRIPGAESAAESFLGAALETYSLDSGGSEPYNVPADIVTALLYYLEADTLRDPRTQADYVKRAESLLFNYRKDVGV